MAAATREDVIRLFGEIDEMTVDRVLATGSDVGELREARGWIDGDEALEQTLGEPSSARVTRVIDLVQAYIEEEEPDDLVPGGLP